MIEREGPPLPVPLQHQLGELLVLLQHDGQILLRELRSIAGRRDDGFHAQLGKAQIQHLLNVLQKVGVRMRKGAAHVVVPAAARLHQLLELGNDPIPASVSGVVHAIAVVDLLAAVQAENDVAHLAVGEVNHIVVNQNAIGGQREAEVLVVLLFNAAGIGNQLLDHVKVHQRFAAEEVHLQVAAVPGMLNQKIQRALADLKAHHRAVAMVLPLAGEAIGAVQVAGMRHVQAERLDHAGGLFLQMSGHGFKGIRRKELSAVAQGGDLIIALFQILRRNVLAIPVLLRHRLQHGPAVVVFEHRDDVIGHLVHGVNRARTDVQHDVVSAQLILMNHRTYFSLFRIKNTAGSGGIRVSAITCFPWCSRTSDWQYRSWSCRQTGRRSGIRRSRHSLRFHTDCGFQSS